MVTDWTLLILNSRLKFVKFITNYEISLESIVEQAIVKAGKIPDLIVNRDAAGNINTGIMFIRCSEMGRKAITKIRELQVSHAHHRLVDKWDSNGCIMLLHKEIEFREVSFSVVYLLLKRK